MESFRLKVFRVAAEELSFTHAAEKLFLTQPAVTMQIKNLEDELNEWLNQWNDLVTNTTIEAAEPLLSGAASRISVINQIYDNLVQLRREQFPVSSQLVSQIEVKSSEFTEYVDENLLKKPPNYKRNWWRLGK